MSNIYNFEDLKRGQKLSVFTACGIFDGIVAENHEAVSNGWMTLNNVAFIPINNFNNESQIIHFKETLVRYDQIIALTSGLTFE